MSKLVFSSSCAVYGIADVLPITENAPRNPISVYGRSKAIVEDILTDLHKAYGFQSISLRYFNAAGADPGGELGEMHDPEPHIIPRVFMAAMGKINKFEILGIDYPTPDGTAIRDYTHVDDLARAHVLSLQYLLQGGDTTAINLGTGRGYSVREVIKLVESVTGRTVPTEVGLRRIGDPAEVIADGSRAYSVIQFRPQYPDLNDMISSAWNWYSSRLLKTG